jgi:phosphatidylglycerol:prolipoprotein diacylglycerol transferase
MALKPGWLPTWLWAQTYDHNILGVLIPAPGVYPTPIYESLISMVCFALLWAVRNHPFKSGWLFSLYLLLAGAERLLIEQIRVNPVIELGALRATQAELIASTLVLFGILGMMLLSGRSRRSPSANEARLRAGSGLA